MRLMGTFARSWQLSRQSWAVLRGNPSLMLFPIFSGVTSIFLTASFFIPLYMVIGVKNIEHPPTWSYPVLFAYYLVSYFVVIFFNAGLIHCSHEALNGRQTSFGSGFAAAGAKVIPILGWALISATVGLVLRTVAERTGVIGRLVVGLIGGAWNIVTFFTVPMLVIEGVGPIAAVKGSIATLKKTWGESLIGSSGITWAIMLLTLVPIPVIVACAFSGVTALIIFSIVFALAFWLGLAIVGSAMAGVYSTAVFTYARTNTIPSGFDEDVIRNAFRSKPPTKVFGRSI